MTQVPGVPEEHPSFDEPATPQEPVVVEPNGQAPSPSPGQPGETHPEAPGRFGRLGQDTLNRWSVRDREAGAPDPKP